MYLCPAPKKNGSESNPRKRQDADPILENITDPVPTPKPRFRIWPYRTTSDFSLSKYNDKNAFRLNGIFVPATKSLSCDLAYNNRSTKTQELQ